MIRRILPIAILALAAVCAHAAETSEALKKARELAGKKDFEGAVKLLRAEAERGDAQAANALGELTLAGRGVKASPVEAMRWFQKAADASLPDGMYNVANLLAMGAEGVPKNEAKARFLTKAAAEAGSAAAQVRMGTAAENEAAAKPGTPDFSEARAWFEKAAAQENPDGLIALMRFADRVGGTAADLQKGTEYCVRAAKAGSSFAMNEMGVRYQQGRGLPKDHVAATGWFALASEHGQLAAFVNLGHCYEIGDGATQDFEIAVRNYTVAAKQNFAPAQFLLAQLMEQGHGTKLDLVGAYVLYLRAGEQKIDEAVKKAEELKKKLSPAQLAEAGKLLKSGSNP